MKPISTCGERNEKKIRGCAGARNDCRKGHARGRQGGWQQPVQFRLHFAQGFCHTRQAAREGLPGRNKVTFCLFVLTFPGVRSWPKWTRSMQPPYASPKYMTFQNRTHSSTG